MYVGSVSKLWRYVYKSLFCCEGWNVNVIRFGKYSILYQRTYFSESITNFDWWAVDIFWDDKICGCTVVFAFLCRCVYTLHPVRLPYSCDKGGEGNFEDISKGGCCLNICMMYSVVVGDGGWGGCWLQKYCDILCNYICGIALCWQSQSKVATCNSRYCFVMT